MSLFAHGWEKMFDEAVARIEQLEAKLAAAEKSALSWAPPVRILENKVFQLLNEVSMHQQQAEELKEKLAAAEKKIKELTDEDTPQAIELPPPIHICGDWYFGAGGLFESKKEESE